MMGHLESSSCTIHACFVSLPFCYFSSYGSLRITRKCGSSPWAIFSNPRSLG